MVDSATIQPAKRRLKMLVQQLSETDIAKLFAFLRVGGARLQAEWEMVSDGACDLLLLGNEEPETVPGLLDNPVVTVRVVDAPNSFLGVQGELSRPLQYEPVIEALQDVERQILGDPEAATERLADSPALVLADAFSVSPGASFRLKRWPPAALLQRDRYRVRLASFLSAAHVRLEELARLSNVELRECEDFVAELITAGIVDVKLAGVQRLPAVAARKAAGLVGAKLQERAPDQGLLGKMRRSFGID